MIEKMNVHRQEDQERYRREGLWLSKTLSEQVKLWATERPTRLAVVDGTDGRRKTFRELNDDVSRVAGWLIAQGIGRGDVVAVQLPNRYETIVIDIAALSVGACLNLLLPNYRRKELEYFLEVTKAKLFVTPGIYRGFDHLTSGRLIVEAIKTRPMHMIVDQEHPHAEVLTLADALSHDPALSFMASSASDVSEIIFTSGTESLPKAVMHTEETVNNSVTASYHHLSLSDQDVVWMPSPIGHSTGFNFGVRLALYHGLPVVLQDIWQPEPATKLIEENRCTYTLCAPTFLSDILHAAKQNGRSLTSLNKFGCGGGPVAAELVREAATQGIDVLRIYGSTEGLIISWNQPSASQNKKENTDGLPLANTDVAVWDLTDNVLPVGSIGEFVVRGPNVCVGFLNDSKRTAATFTHDGWLRTGDLGLIDSEGYVTVTGRKKEIIIRGGLNIAPREIEDLLIDMPKLKDVAVIGVPDERLGEIVGVCAVVEKNSKISLEDIIRYLKQKNLAQYKFPQRLFIVGEIPRTTTGKIQRYQLVKQVVETGAAA